MADSEPDRCGIFPCTFGGWMLAACIWHDQAYKKGSWQMEHLSREYVDRVFYNQLLELATRGTFKAGKRLQALIAYRFVREFGSTWWEGREFGEPSIDTKEIVACWLSRNSSLSVAHAFV